MIFDLGKCLFKFEEFVMDILIELNIICYWGWKVDDKMKLFDLFEKVVVILINKEWV